MKDTALENASRNIGAIRAQMAADRAPVYHDNGDFQLVPFQPRSHQAERTPRMCQPNPRALT